MRTAALLGLALLLTALPAQAFDGLAVSRALADQSEPVLLPDGSGGAWAAWIDARSGFTKDVYYLHLTSEGVRDPLFPRDGRWLTLYGCSKRDLVLAQGGEAGPFAAWSDVRCDGQSDIYVARLAAVPGAATGFPLYGLRVTTTSTLNEVAPQLLPDGAGGVFVAWLDSTSLQPQLRAHHVLATGALDTAWPAAGVLVASGVDRGSRPQLMSDRAGGMYLAWERRLGSERDLYAQRLTRTNGTPVAGWPVGGIAVCNAPGDQSGLRMVPDGGTGAYLAWLDRRAIVPHIAAVHLTAAGTAATGWTTSGEFVSDSDVSPSPPSIAATGDGGLYVCWSDAHLPSRGRDIWMQRLMPQGGRAIGWGPTALALTDANGDQTAPQIVSAGPAAAYVVWLDDAALPQSGRDVTGQFVETSVTPLVEWGHAGAPVCRASGAQNAVTLVTSGEFEALALWTDARAAAQNGLDLYTARLTAGGVAVPAVRGLTATFRSGQTFLTWINPPGPDWTNRVYRSTVPITDASVLAGATRVATLAESSAVDRRFTSITGQLTSFRTDSLAAELDPAQGLFVYTAAAAQDSWYAVTLEAVGDSESRVFLPGGNATVAATHEFVQMPQPVFQRNYNLTRKQTNVYTLWTSNRDVPGFPAMSNRDGTPFDCAMTLGTSGGPLMFMPHARSRHFLDNIYGTGAASEWVLAPDDPLPNGENTFWFGYHPGYDPTANPSSGLPPLQGQVVDYTYRRIHWTLDWALARYPVDRTRVYAWGVSMGGIGSVELGFWDPTRIAAVTTVAGKFDFSYVNDPAAGNWFNNDGFLRAIVDRMWGTVSSDLPSSRGEPTYHALDLAAIALDAPVELPPVLAINGKRDLVTGWAEKPAFYAAMQQGRRAGTFFWDANEHQLIGTGPWAAYGQMNSVFRYRLDTSFPAFSNCSADDAPGNGSFASGDSVGQINGFMDWATPAEDAGGWEDVLMLRDLTLKDTGVRRAPDSLTVTVTPLRRQRFRPPSGLRVPYRVERLNGSLIGSGNVTVEASGRIVVPGVRVLREGSRLKLGTLGGGGVDVPGGGSAPVRFSLRPLANPVRGEAALELGLPAAARAEVRVYDVAGRQVREYVRTAATGSQVSLRLGVLPPGLYLAEARFAGERRLTRFVVLR